MRSTLILSTLLTVLVGAMLPHDGGKRMHKRSTLQRRQNAKKDKIVTATFTVTQTFNIPDFVPATPSPTAQAAPAQDVDNSTFNVSNYDDSNDSSINPADSTGSTDSSMNTPDGSTVTNEPVDPAAPSTADAPVATDAGSDDSSMISPDETTITNDPIPIDPASLLTTDDSLDSTATPGLAITTLSSSPASIPNTPIATMIQIATSTAELSLSSAPLPPVSKTKLRSIAPTSTVIPIKSSSTAPNMYTPSPTATIIATSTSELALSTMPSIIFSHIDSIGAAPTNTPVSSTAPAASAPIQAPFCTSASLEEYCSNDTDCDSTQGYTCLGNRCLPPPTATTVDNGSACDQGTANTLFCTSGVGLCQDNVCVACRFGG